MSSRWTQFKPSQPILSHPLPLEVSLKQSEESSSATQTSSRSQIIDASRGIAALWVLMFHAVLYLELSLRGGILGHYPDSLVAGTSSRVFVDTGKLDALDKFLHILMQPLLAGHFGVPMFFVVSGFCIHMPLARLQALGTDAQINTANYCKRRFLRLYPTHAFAVAGSIVLISLTHVLLVRAHMGTIIAMPLSVLAAHFAMIQAQLTKTAGYLFYYNANLWSLETEIQLYLVYLVGSRYLSKIRWFRFLTILAILDVAYSGFRFCTAGSFEWEWATQTFFFGHLFEWYLGAFLAHRLVRGRGEVINTFWELSFLLSLVVVSFQAWNLTLGTKNIDIDMIFAAGFSLGLWWLLNNDALREARFSPWHRRIFVTLTYLGERSYSLYLWQSPVIRSVVVCAIIYTPWLGAHYYTALMVAAVAGLTAVAVSLLAYELVERHFVANRTGPVASVVRTQQPQLEKYSAPT